MDLVIMAAGMGSRFGGLKQVEPINDNGEFIIDYSIYDAIRCGFDKVVFIIKEENYDLFRNTVGKRIEDKIDVEYVFQKIDHIPEGFTVPEDRVKPWGTGHAILECMNTVKDDFVIINADDFYGYDAFKRAAEFLKNKKKSDNHYALIGYVCENTLTENGSCKRGMCSAKNGKLTTIQESLIEKINGKIFATPLDTDNTFEIDPKTLVSMNMWCFSPTLFKELNKRFQIFLEENLEANPMKCEYLIPTVIGEMLEDGLIEVSVENTTAKWYGVTYKEDKEMVVNALKKMTENGLYPAHLWKEKIQTTTY